MARRSAKAKASHAYQRIADDLRRKIMNGTYPAGEMLPSLSRLMSEYDASITPVRMALDTLRHERLVSSHQGKGTFVLAPEQARFEYLERAVRDLQSEVAELRRSAAERQQDH